MVGMDEERLEEMFREYRNNDISEEEWVEATTPRERMWAVMQHDDPDEGEILTMEQLTIAMEISNKNTAPDEIDPVDPEEIDGPADPDISNITVDESE